MRRFLFLLTLVTLNASAAPLPLVEVPATSGSSDTLVVFVSGDGGWAKIDKSIASALAAQGMPVVGLNSLQYFWVKRTPDSTARDLESVITSHLAQSGKRRVVLAGYSRGADILPPVVARLTQETRAKIRLVALLSPSRSVEFEFHVADWMRDSSRGLPVRPELQKVREKTICVWGEDDRESLCNGLAQSNVEVITLKGAHHFEGDYAQIAQLILGALR